jgi:hypothetical protein
VVPEIHKHENYFKGSYNKESHKVEVSERIYFILTRKGGGEREKNSYCYPAGIMGEKLKMVVLYL